MKSFKKVIIAGLMISGLANAQSNTSLLHDGVFVANPNAPAGALDCDNGATASVYGQPIDVANFGTARTSDVEIALTVSESIVNGAGVITPMAGGMTDSISFWGLSLEFDAGFVATCTEDNTALTPFEITFHADAAGVPGAAITTVVATPTLIEDTAVPFAFTTIFKWDVSFPETDLTGAAWVTIQRQQGVNTAGGNQCLFLWLDETLPGSYDDSAFSSTNGVEPTDQAFCISEAAAPPVPAVPVPTLNFYSVLLLLLALSGSVFFVYRKS